VTEPARFGVFVVADYIAANGLTDIQSPSSPCPALTDEADEYSGIADWPQPME
jgi:hypothetical protein